MEFSQDLVLQWLRTPKAHSRLSTMTGERLADGLSWRKTNSSLFPVALLTTASSRALLPTAMLCNRSMKLSVSPKVMASSSNAMLNTAWVLVSQRFANGVVIRWNHGEGNVVPLEMEVKQMKVMMRWTFHKRFLSLTLEMNTTVISSEATQAQSLVTVMISELTFWLLSLIIFLLFRQNCDHYWALSNKNFGVSFGCYLCAYGVCLLVYLVLLLHEEMDEATKNDALNSGFITWHVWNHLRVQHFVINRPKEEESPVETRRRVLKHSTMSISNLLETLILI